MIPSRRTVVRSEINDAIRPIFYSASRGLVAARAHRDVGRDAVGGSDARPSTSAWTAHRFVRRKRDLRALANLSLVARLRPSGARRFQRGRSDRRTRRRRAGSHCHRGSRLAGPSQTGHHDLRLGPLGGRIRNPQRGLVRRQRCRSRPLRCRISPPRWPRTRPCGGSDALRQRRGPRRADAAVLDRIDGCSRYQR